MQTSDDMSLVREFAGHQNEAAFEALVARHVDLVYSAALRQTGDAHLAEEITQAVFLVLARKAGSLRRETFLAGWLPIFSANWQFTKNLSRFRVGGHVMSR